MIRITTTATLCAALLVASAPLVARAASAPTKTDVDAAIAIAASADAQAGKLEYRWPAGVKALKDAKTAAAVGALDKALALAKEAKALADLEVAQANEQAAPWLKMKVQ